MKTNVLAAAIFLTSSSAFAACVPGTWGSPNPADYAETPFPVQLESEHFQIRWPANKPNYVSKWAAQESLRKFEALYSFFMSAPINWPEPFCNSAQKTKIQIFSDDGYGTFGSGIGSRTPAMWVPQGLLASGNAHEHEFSHAMQFSSGGLRNSDYSGWMWESHAEFMTHQFPRFRSGVGCTADHAWMPHIYYGSTQNRYCNWQFWEYIKDTYGMQAVNSMFTGTVDIYGQDPLAVLRNQMGWSDAQFNDVFGRYAMRNVNWDYISPDGFNKGSVFRARFGANTDRSGDIAKQLRLTRLEAIDKSRGRYVVNNYWAPQRFGYNVVRLVPESGASSIQISFRGVVQDKPAADYGKDSPILFEPGYNGPGANPAMANPVPSADSDWRWGVVAISQSGTTRYSALQSGAVGALNFALQPGDDVYMVVVATPKKFHAIYWGQKYNTLYRYPWKVELMGAIPDGHQPGFNPGFPAGRRHSNGGGWVANGAYVEDSAFVGPNAAVLGGEVRGNARIEDYAVVWNGTVSDNAIIGGLTQFDKSNASGNAQIRLIRGGAQTFGNCANRSTFTGDVKLFGDLEAHLCGETLSTGVYTGYITPELVVKPEWGANRRSLPAEVTASVPNGWDGSQVIRSVTQPNAALRHAYFLLYSNDASPTVERSNLDFQWNVRSGLAGKCTSFESVNYPGYFIRHENYRLKISRNDGSELLKQDATFCERSRSSGKAWESVNFSGYFWYMNANNELWIEQNDGTPDFLNRSSFSMPGDTPTTSSVTWGSNVVNKQQGGNEGSTQLQVCRGNYNNGVHAGKTWPGYNNCNIGWGGKEILLPNFEYLAASANFTWSGTLANRIPVSAGQADGKSVYVCRAAYNNGIHPGKTWDGFNACNIGYGGNEITLTNYEYLTTSK